MDDLTLKDMGNDDFNLIVGSLVIELSRSSYAPDWKPVWKWWRIRLRRMVVAADGNGRTVTDKNLVRFLEHKLDTLKSQV